jgi:hypothetical protein
VQVNPASRQHWAQRVRQLHAQWAPRLFTRDRDITPVMAAVSYLPGALTRCYDELAPMTMTQRQPLE